MFKIGDKVRFKKEFYKEEYFKGLTREKRKRVADVASLGEFEVFCEDRCRVHVTDKFKVRYNIDASLLELCKFEKEPAKVKVGDKIRITRYQGGDVAGTVATVIYVAGTEIAYKSKKSKSGKYWASNDACKLVTEPEIKEVKRVAKVVEWIKIVNPFMTFGDYKEGDIFKVKEKYDRDSVQAFGTFDTCICKSEYVVLENYKPEEKPSATPKEEPKKIAKVGDFIELTVYNFGDKIGTISEVLSVDEMYAKYRSETAPKGYYFSRHDSYKIVEPPKRKWTPEEIVKAKCFLAEELIHHHCNFSVFGNETRCYCFARCKTAASKPDAKDEYNEYIGAAVAYCKASGVKIPEFIKH